MNSIKGAGQTELVNKIGNSCGRVKKKLETAESGNKSVDRLKGNLEKFERECEFSPGTEKDLMDLFLLDYIFKEKIENLEKLNNSEGRFYSHLRDLCACKGEDKEIAKLFIKVFGNRLLMKLSTSNSNIKEHKFSWRVAHNTIETVLETSYTKIFRDVENLEVLLPIVPFKSLYTLQHLHLLKHIWEEWLSKGSGKKPITHLYWNQQSYRAILDGKIIDGIEKHFEFWPPLWQNPSKGIWSYLEDNFLSSFRRLLLNSNFGENTFEEYINNIGMKRGQFDGDHLEQDERDEIVSTASKKHWLRIADAGENYLKQYLLQRVSEVLGALKEREGNSKVILFVPVNYCFPLNKALKRIFKKREKSKPGEIEILGYLSPTPSYTSFFVNTYSHLISTRAIKDESSIWNKYRSIASQNLGSKIISHCLSELKETDIPSGSMPFVKLAKHVSEMYKATGKRINEYLKYL